MEAKEKKIYLIQEIEYAILQQFPLLLLGKHIIATSGHLKIFIFESNCFMCGLDYILLPPKVCPSVSLSASLLLLFLATQVKRFF